MTINAKQFSDQIVIPTLVTLGNSAGVPYSDTAYHLVMGTIAQESLLGTWLVQTAGPALGIVQIEPPSLETVLSGLSMVQAKVLSEFAMPGSPEHNVVNSLPYAVAICRYFYWQKPPALPADTVTDLFSYYKQWYNTPAGEATLSQWMQNWLLTGIDLALE